MSRKSEFACGIRGYDALAGALCGAASRKQGARAKLHAQGLAYVDFALRHPGRFQMMFANKRLVAAAAAWSTAHGFATLALEEKFGSVRSAAGLREVMKTLNRVLDYLWPASDAHRYTARIKA